MSIGRAPAWIAAAMLAGACVPHQPEPDTVAFLDGLAAYRVGDLAGLNTIQRSLPVAPPPDADRARVNLRLLRLAAGRRPNLSEEARLLYAERLCAAWSWPNVMLAVGKWAQAPPDPGHACRAAQPALTAWRRAVRLTERTTFDARMLQASRDLDRRGMTVRAPWSGATIRSDGMIVTEAF